MCNKVKLPKVGSNAIVPQGQGPTKEKECELGSQEPATWFLTLETEYPHNTSNCFLLPISTNQLREECNASWVEVVSLCFATNFYKPTCERIPHQKMITICYQFLQVTGGLPTHQIVVLLISAKPISGNQLSEDYSPLKSCIFL